MRPPIASALLVLALSAAIASACGSSDERRSAQSSGGGEAGQAGEGGAPTSQSPSAGAGGDRAGAADGSVTATAGAGGATDAGGETALGGASGAGGAAVCGRDGTMPVGSFDDDFAQGLNAKHWSITQTTPDLFSADDTHGDLRLAKIAANPGALQNVAINLDMASVGGPVAGDFETSVSFSNASFGGAGIHQVELHANFEDASFFFDVYDTSSGLNVHVWNGSIQGTTATTATGGKFRIARSGSVLSGYLDDALIFSTSSASTLTAIAFVLQLQPGVDGSESVTFDDFHLEGPCISGD